MNMTTDPRVEAALRRPPRKDHHWKALSFISGSVALAAGLIMEFVPFYGQGHTIPQANAVCSGVGGLFVQGLAKAFAGAKEAAQVSAACGTATTAERFIGPLIIGGVLLLGAGIVLAVRDRNAARAQ